MRSLPFVSIVLAGLVGPPATAATAEPPGFEYFHTYAENEQVIDDAVAAHSAIAKKISIGQSYQGRKIWGIKISDNVGKDEREPELFINGLTHARERASNEMAVYLIQLLTDGYDTSARIRRVVNTREVWIVPMLSPDGAEFDMSGGRWHTWRKNRQPIPGSNSKGIDLNRNFGYQWGKGGGTGTSGSANPSSDYYRGWAPEVAPEVQAYEAFERSRVVSGKQQIRASLSFHAAAKRIIWPSEDDPPPPDSHPEDYDAMTALAKIMASKNGYAAKEGVGLYPTYGNQDDWAYHEYRIFTYTIEMAKGAERRYYPTPEELAVDLERNGKAVLAFLEDAGCAYRLIGRDDLCARYG